jgi:ribonuclease HI
MHPTFVLSTNNMVELEGLLHGIVIAQKYGFQSLEVEGDSRVLLLAMTKILDGVHLDRVLIHWILSHGIAKLGHMVKSLVAIIPKTIHKKANSMADCMENVGVMMQDLYQL